MPAVGTVTGSMGVNASGETLLELNYHRPREEGVEPLETYSIRVMVHLVADSGWPSLLLPWGRLAQYRPQLER